MSEEEEDIDLQTPPCSPNSWEPDLHNQQETTIDSTGKTQNSFEKLHSLRAVSNLIFELQEKESSLHLPEKIKKLTNTQTKRDITKVPQPLPQPLPSYNPPRPYYPPVNNVHRKTIVKYLQDESDAVRTIYRCQRCGKPKKGHICSVIPIEIQKHSYSYFPTSVEDNINYTHQLSSPSSYLSSNTTPSTSTIPSTTTTTTSTYEPTEFQTYFRSNILNLPTNPFSSYQLSSPSPSLSSSPAFPLSTPLSPPPSTPILYSNQENNSVISSSTILPQTLHPSSASSTSTISNSIISTTNNTITNNNNNNNNNSNSLRSSNNNNNSVNINSNIDNCNDNNIGDSDNDNDNDNCNINNGDEENVQNEITEFYLNWFDLAVVSIDNLCNKVQQSKWSKKSYFISHLHNEIRFLRDMKQHFIVENKST